MHKVDINRNSLRLDANSENSEDAIKEAQAIGDTVADNISIVNPKKP